MLFRATQSAMERAAAKIGGREPFSSQILFRSSTNHCAVIQSELIAQFATNMNLFRTMVNSMCPE
jgi:hypothetical protein